MYPNPQSNPPPPNTQTHIVFWSIGMGPFVPHMSFRNQTEPQLINLILKIIIVPPKPGLKIYVLNLRCFFGKLRGFFWNALTLSIFEVEIFSCDKQLKKWWVVVNGVIGCWWVVMDGGGWGWVVSGEWWWCNFATSTLAMPLPLTSQLRSAKLSR